MTDVGGPDDPGAPGDSEEPWNPWPVDDGSADVEVLAPEFEVEVEPEAEPTPRSEARAVRAAKVRRRRRVVGSVLGLLIIIVGVFALWYHIETEVSGPPGPLVVLNVGNGESISSVVQALSSQHVIRSSLAFQVSEVFDGNLSASPGFYALHQNESFGQVRSILGGQPDVSVVDLLPGLTLHEVAERVGDAPGHTTTGFGQTANSGVVRSLYSPSSTDDLEGLLGTGTYYIVPGESDTTVLRQMVQQFDRQATAAGVNSASARALGLTPYEVITAASVVEKEGYIVKNMPDVARVVYNRLAADMALQMDSTVLYALGQDGGPVTAADEQVDSPYNTYLNKGLPPTPICSPSPSALAAAAHPPAGAWLYFELVKKDGTEAFANTYAEQLANEALSASRGLG
jgi:UPF0755 protein